MRTIRNATALAFFVGLIVDMDVTPDTQPIQRCYAYWRRCANGTHNPSLPGGIPTCETLLITADIENGCCSGSAEPIEPTIGCGNPAGDR